MRPSRLLGWTLRFAALLLALLYLPLALVWAYWIAALGAAMPLLALGLLHWADRREDARGEDMSEGLFRLHQAATGLSWGGLAVAVVALLYTLTTN